MWWTASGCSPAGVRLRQGAGSVLGSGEARLLAATRADGQEAAARQQAWADLTALEHGIQFTPDTTSHSGMTYLLAGGFLPGHPVQMSIDGKAVAKLRAGDLGTVTYMIAPSLLKLAPGQHTVTLGSLLLNMTGRSISANPGAGIRPGQLEEAQDQKSWFIAEFLVVPGIARAHCFGWDRLDKFLDEESGIGGSRAQSRQRLTPKVHRLVARWGVPDVGFQNGLKVGTAFAQPVHHRVLRRYHNCPARAQDAAELGKCGRAVARVMNGQRADDQVESAIRIGQRLPQRRLVDLHSPCRPRSGQAHHDRARIEGGDLGPSLQ